MQRDAGILLVQNIDQLQLHINIRRERRYKSKRTLSFFPSPPSLVLIIRSTMAIVFGAFIYARQFCRLTFRGAEERPIQSFHRRFKWQ